MLLNASLAKHFWAFSLPISVQDPNRDIQPYDV